VRALVCLASLRIFSVSDDVVNPRIPAIAHLR
jgi:hypothetical protein